MEWKVKELKRRGYICQRQNYEAKTGKKKKRKEAETVTFSCYYSTDLIWTKKKEKKHV